MDKKRRATHWVARLFFVELWPSVWGLACQRWRQKDHPDV
ncbi:hypothetical protein PG5_16740 [Pseudomonas sp. G5(2012)]|nr:hypothetical protein PG5_16740 [Pseudomonas sp. G5(2012)]